MPITEAKDRWATAQKALSTLDTIRPNPKNILSKTIELKHGYIELYNEYYEGQTTDGRKYCFIDWAQEGEVMNYYYWYRDGSGLAFQAELQKELDKRGFITKLRQLEESHDVKKGKPQITEGDFLTFMIENDVLVPGPLPAPIESVLKGEGTALWMPKDLYQLTSRYGLVNRQDK